MNNKLKYPIKLENGKVLSTIEEELLFFEERERLVRESFYVNSSSKIDEDDTSGKCCYGIEII